MTLRLIVQWVKKHFRLLLFAVAAVPVAWVPAHLMDVSSLQEAVFTTGVWTTLILAWEGTS